MGITKTELFSEQQNELARLAKALGHPARIAILHHILKSNSCINTQLVEETGLAQATVSQHLRELKEAGLIQGTIDGTRLCYCIDPENWKKVENLFSELFASYAPLSGDCC